MKNLMLTISSLGLLALVATGGQAHAVTRSCKAMWFVKYAVKAGGLEQAKSLSGPQNVIGHGSSPGAFGSPVKARRRACEQAARKAGTSMTLAKAKIAVCNRHRGAQVAINGIGGWGQSQLEIQTWNRKMNPGQSFRCNKGTGGKVISCRQKLLDEQRAKLGEAYKKLIGHIDHKDQKMKNAKGGFDRHYQMIAKELKRCL